MSHFTTIETQIRDVNALREACREMGLDVIEQAEARGFGGQRRRGDLVIKLAGPYDLAVTRKEDGTCELATDWWGGHVEKEVGAGFGKLLQFYGVCKAQAEARREGYTSRRQTLKDGSIKLTIGGVR